MKHLFAAAAIAAFTAIAVNAAEITFAPRNPWTAVGENDFICKYDGSKKWPGIAITPTAPLKPETYYRISFEASDSSGATKLLVTHSDLADGKKFTGYASVRANSALSEFCTYIYTRSEKAKLSIYFNPGPAADLRIRNIKVEEVPDLSGNLLTLGDFESGSALSGNDLYGESKDASKNVSTGSAGFLCGEKSLYVKKPAGLETGVTTSPLPAVPGKTVKLKFWAKSVKDGVPARVKIDFFHHGQNRHLYKIYNFRIEPEWKEYTYEYPVPADTDLYNALKFGMCRVSLLLAKSRESAEVCFDNMEYSIQE